MVWKNRSKRIIAMSLAVTMLSVVLANPALAVEEALEKEQIGAVATLSPTQTVEPPVVLPSECPTATLTPSPIGIATPTATQAPTVSPAPTATQAPTVSPAPTATQAPTVSPAPTATQAPMVSPVPTATLAPEVSATTQATVMPVFGNNTATAANESGVPYPVEGGNIYFDSSTGTVTSADAGITSAVIPEQINGVTVTAIGQYAFYENSALSSVVLPTSVTTIGAGAFCYCSSLGEITIPEGVTELPDFVFYCCTALSSVGIPTGLTIIGASAFYYCWDLGSIALPSGLTTIGASAFYHCTSLSDIVLPANVTEIGPSALADCELITSIEIPSGLTAIPEKMFSGCENLSNVNIPSSVTTIEPSAFYACRVLSSIALPANVTRIGQGAFAHCYGLTGIDIPAGVRVIEAYTFEYCTSLSSITIPAGVTSIEDWVFSHCHALSSVVLPDSVTAIRAHAFDCCFALCSIDLPANLTLLGENSFYGCALERITIPSSVTTIDGWAFAGCDEITEVVIPSGVTSCGMYIFSGCRGLRNAKISSGVTAIGEGMFYLCTSLDQIEIPDSVTSIGDKAFYECTSLGSIEIPSGVTSIGAETFAKCTGFSSIEIPAGVTSIGDRAFYECTELKKIVIPNSVTAIGTYVFAYCDQLRSVQFSTGLTTTGEDTFEECLGLKSFLIPNGVEVIGDSTFMDCYNLASVQIPKSVRVIESCAFRETGLTDVFYAGSKSEWDAITIHDSNEPDLEWDEPTIHYNSTMPDGSTPTLKGETVQDNALHYIKVAHDGVSPVGGARIMVGDTAYTTDENGIVAVMPSAGVSTVTVSANGYYEQIFLYELRAGQTQNFYLRKNPSDGMPYVTLVQETQKYLDLKTNAIHVTKEDGQSVSIQVLANWGECEAGQYVIYQKGTAIARGKSLTREYNPAQVQVFAPGDVFEPEKPLWLKLVAADGTESTPVRLNIEIADKVTNFEKVDEGLTLPSASGSVSDKNATAIFPGDYSLKCAQLPIEIGKEFDPKTGQTTQKITVGLKDAASVMKGNEWESYKDSIDKANNNVNQLQQLKGVLNRFGAKHGGVTLVKGWKKPEFELLGYIELVYDAAGNLISTESGVIGAVSGKYTNASQYMAGPVPMYLTFTFQPEASLSGALVLDVENAFVGDSKLPISLDGKLKIETKATLDGGLGISGLATVGASGSAKLEMEVLPDFKGEAELKANLSAYLLWVCDWEYTFAKKTFTLWDNSRAANRAFLLEDEVIDQSVALASREYADKTTAWNSMCAAGIAGDGEATLMTLQSWVMPCTMPEIVEVAGQKMLIFTADNASATAGNNVQLMYSLYDAANGTWAAPLPVCAGNTSDLYYAAYVENDTLYIAQQKVRAELSQTNDAERLLQELCSKTDICVSVWDATNNRFDTTYVLQDATIDMYPTIAFHGDTLTAVWVSNSANDIMGKSGTYTIWASDLVAGSWQAPRALYSTELYISELETGYCGDHLEVVWAYGMGTGAGNIYHLVDGAAQMLPGQEDTGMALNFQEGIFYWSSNGVVKTYNPLTDTVDQIVTGEEQAIQSNYRVATSENATAVVWLSTSELGESTLYASLFEEGHWSKPIVIYTAPDFEIQYMDVFLAQDGAWDFILNTLRTDVSGETMASIVYLNAESKADVTMLYAFADEGARTAQGMQPIECIVENNGQEPVTALSVEVYDADLNVFYRETVPTSIAVGESKTVMVTANLSDVATKTQLYVFAKANGETETQDNDTDFVVGGVDVSVAVTQDLVDDSVVFNVTVENSQAIASDVTLQFFENATDETALEEVTIERLDNRESYRYQFMVDRYQLKFDEKSYKHYCIVATTDAYDINLANNEAYTVLSEQEEAPSAEGELEEVTIVAVTGVSVSQSTLAMEYSAEQENTAILTATVAPSNATNQSVVWASSDSSVVSVNEGVVTAKAVGTAYITATTKEGAFVAQTFVTVTEAVVLGHDITLNFGDVGNMSEVVATTNAQGQLETLPAPIRAGYTFIGWFTSASDGAFISTDTVFQADATIYAHWQKSYGTLGDVNGDTKISVKDAIQLAQAVDNNGATLTKEEYYRADITADGSITQDDFATVLIRVLQWYEIEFDL